MYNKTVIHIYYYVYLHTCARAYLCIIKIKK